jgi:hypothetical protein
MIASKTFNTKMTITDTQFARDHVLPVTKDKAHVSLRFLPHEYLCAACAITLPIAFYVDYDTHNLDQPTIDKHLKETHLENNLFVLKSLLSGITMRCTNSITEIPPQIRRLIPASSRETCSPKEPSLPRVVVVDH